MKKFISILMMLAIVLSLSVTAFAAEEKGSITIVNPTINQKYRLYKLFDATYSGKNVSYTISDDNVYDLLFDSNGAPVAGNVYFTYNKENNQVKKVESANDAELLQYVKALVQNGSVNHVSEKTAGATDKTIVFDNIPCGYYIVDVVGDPSAAKGMITVTTNTPDATVIDKNQLPFADGISKKVSTVIIENGNVAYENGNIKTTPWADENSAFVGDVVGYKVTFNATNYAGMEQIRHYTIHDEKGNALWVEFGDDDNPYDIVVKVGNTQLKKGYYHLADEAIKTNVQEWEYLGTWTSEEKEAQEEYGNVAEWYLVHYEYDKFEIVIPWLNNYKYIAPTINAETGKQESYAFELEFADDATSKFNANERVEVVYYASVEPNADIGKTDNLRNEAFVKWTGKNATKTSETATVYTHVDGIAIHKMDSSNNAALPGAVFKLFMDEACTKPLYVIPTDIEGVYVYDDKFAPGQSISGMNKLTARKIYEGFLSGDFKTAQSNEVVTPKNGKIVITGVKDGTYYVKEVEAPDGYNCIGNAIRVEAGNANDRFYIYASDPVYPNAQDSEQIFIQGKVENIQSATITYKQHEYNVAVVEVLNTPGTMLPSTGGEGTFWFVTIGTLMVIGFAIFLVTHKKMSAYTD